MGTGQGHIKKSTTKWLLSKLLRPSIFNDWTQTRNRHLWIQPPSLTYMLGCKHTQFILPLLTHRLTYKTTWGTLASGIHAGFHTVADQGLISRRETEVPLLHLFNPGMMHKASFERRVPWQQQQQQAVRHTLILRIGKLMPIGSKLLTHQNLNARTRMQVSWHCSVSYSFHRTIQALHKKGYWISKKSDPMKEECSCPKSEVFGFWLKSN